MNPADPPLFPLTPQAFGQALRTGQGRALLHVQRHGAQGLEDQILQACVTCVSYDPECEDSRAVWLLALVDAANLRPKLVEALAAQVRQPPPEDRWDLTQRSAILRELATTGNAQAKALLYQSLARMSDYDHVVAYGSIIVLDGIEGLLHVAREWGRWLLDDPDFGVHSWFMDTLPDTMTAEQAMAALQDAAGSDADIARWLAALRSAQDAQSARESTSPATEQHTWTAAQVLAHLTANPKDPCYWLRTWGMQADAVQREVIFQALLHAPGPELARSLLHCLAYPGIPRFEPRLLDWLDSPDTRLRYALKRALSRVQHPALREAALQWVSTGDLAPGLSLLVSNFEPGDFALCVQHLHAARDSDDDHRHHLSLDTLNLCEAHPGQDAQDCLFWVYAFSPCSLCRSRAARALADLGLAPDWMLEEAAFDADADTRALQPPLRH